jgi:16S rRNA (guanine966-N2)-methyltransferase
MAGTILMRIIGGAAKGRRLDSPGEATRPLTGKAREALFSILGENVQGADVLDLYAGSGSLGLEALSRGAASAVFVERDRATLDALERNVLAVGLGGRIEPVGVETFLDRANRMFGLVFVDPPYVVEDVVVNEVLSAVERYLGEPGTVVVHRRAGGPVPQSDNLRLTDRRRYGDDELWLFEKEGA